MKDIKFEKYKFNILITIPEQPYEWVKRLLVNH
jgi:hypothetical protein